MIKKLILDFNHCDPKRCSAQKLLKLNLCYKTTSLKSFSGITLSPDTNTYFSKSDIPKIHLKGLAVLDCSWSKFNELNFLLNKRFIRKLPFIVSSNPINYGKPYKLNCVEAFASVFYMAGMNEEAERVLEPFQYKNEFYKLNEEVFELYKNCNTSEEVAVAEREYISKYSN